MEKLQSLWWQPVIQFWYTANKRHISKHSSNKSSLIIVFIPFAVLTTEMFKGKKTIKPTGLLDKNIQFANKSIALSQ